MRATAVALAALVVGCASAGRIGPVETAYWKDENFAGYESYAWLPSDSHQRTETQDHRLHDLIRDSIDERLAAKGLVRAHAHESDFLVTYHCKITEELRADVIDRVWYGTGDQGKWEDVTRRVELSSFEQGSIVIDFAKPDRARWVWRGIARGRILPDATPEELQEIVDRSVREILDEFPPKR